MPAAALRSCRPVSSIVSSVDSESKPSSMSLSVYCGLRDASRGEKATDGVGIRADVGCQWPTCDRPGWMSRGKRYIFCNDTSKR